MTASSSSSTAAGFVVLNPVAGEGRPDKIRQILQTYLNQDEYDLYETTGEENLGEVVQTAVQQHAYNWVAAAGGDGTVSQVADGLAGGEVPLAILPAGTANVLAETLGIPSDLEAACQLLAHPPNVRKIDGLQVGQQHFFLRLGVGLESITMKETSSAQKNRLGTAAYILTILKEFSGWQPHEFTLSIDGQTHRMRASELVLANSGQLGIGNLEWRNKIAPDDGRIDIAVVQARSALDYLRVAAALWRGEQHSSAHVQYFSAREEVRVAARRPLPVHGDGEILERKLPLTAVVKPGVLGVLTPQNAD